MAQAAAQATASVTDRKTVEFPWDRTVFGTNNFTIERSHHSADRLVIRSRANPRAAIEISSGQHGNQLLVTPEGCRLMLADVYTGTGNQYTAGYEAYAPADPSAKPGYNPGGQKGSDYKPGFSKFDDETR